MGGDDDVPATVGEFVERTLPNINANLDWAQLREQFDPDPVGNTLGMVLFAERDANDHEVVESFGLRVGTGPRIELVPYSLEQAIDPNRPLGLGDVVTPRETAIEVLHPDRELTPQKACYQRGLVEVNAADPRQNQRVWLVASAIMEMVTEELEHLFDSAEV